MRWVCASVFLIILSGTPELAWPQGIDPVSRLRTTSLGIHFEVNTVFDEQIAHLIGEIRREISSQRSRGKLIVYISTPISTRGGGYTPVNVELSGHVKKHLEQLYGEKYLWCLAPGQPIRPGGESVRIKDVDGIKAEGGDYMYMWTQVLAGEDGQGRDFDMVYFTGPSDFRRYLRIQGPNLLGKLDQYIDRRARDDGQFKKDIADRPVRRRGFLRYYGSRAGAAYSTGAHDEWNIFVQVNRKRDIGNLISMYFDGRPLSTVEMDRMVTSGYEKQPRLPRSR